MALVIGFGVLAAAALAFGWLVALSMLYVNAYVFWRATRATAGERIPSGFPILAGLGAVFMMYMSLGVANSAKVEVPMEWMWLVAPLFLDMLGLGGLLVTLVRMPFASKKTGSGDRPG